MTSSRDMIAVLLVLTLGLSAGCAPRVAAPEGKTEAPPTPAPAPPAGAPPQDNAYFFFLSAQKERRAGKTDKAIWMIRRAIELDPDSSYLQRELATIHLQNKEEEKALGVVEDFLKKHPQDVNGLILFGSIQQMRRQAGAAIQAYEKVIRLDPAQERIYPVLASLYLETKDPDSAERVLRDFVAKYPGSYDGLFLLGRVHLSRGRKELAAREFAKAAAMDPESIEPLFELVKIAREKGQRDEVLKLSRQILERDPENTRALLETALVYRRSGSKPEADRILFRLGERSLTEFEVILQLIQHYVDPKKYEESLVLIEGMLKAAPDSADLRYLKGFALFGLKKNAEALPEFRRVTPVSRFYSDALVHTAFILQEQDKTDEALELLEAASRANPENADLRYYMGTIQEEAGRLDEAEKSLQLAIEKDPQNSRYFFRLGVVHDKKNDKPASLDAMRKVLALDPKNASALNYIGYTYAELGENLEEAEKLIRQALEYKPNDGYITDSLGWVYYKMGDYARAMEYLKKASALVPDDPTILEHIGDTYLKLNDKANALKYYQKALAKKDKDKEALANKIKQLKGRGR